MTKMDGRTKKEAARQSRNRCVDWNGALDLVQHHEVIRFDDPHRIFEEGEGAMEALIEARDAGKIRYIGFTGHKDPHVHLCMSKKRARHGFGFDTVQMPLNVMDAHYRSLGRGGARGGSTKISACSG